MESIPETSVVCSKPFNISGSCRGVEANKMLIFHQYKLKSTCRNIDLSSYEYSKQLKNPEDNETPSDNDIQHFKFQFTKKFFYKSSN